MHVKSMSSVILLCSFALSTIGTVSAANTTDKDVSRGKLLYSLHCVSCHNEQVH